MPAAKSSSSGGSRGSGRAKSSSSRSRPAAQKSAARRGGAKTSARQSTVAEKTSGVAEGLTGLAEQLVSYVINPLGLVLLTRERIQDTLDQAAARGRLTRTDANEIAAELVRRGRLQTDELLVDAERLIDRGREQLDSATMRSRFGDGVDRIVRTADRARRTVGVGTSFPILGYDELTATQVHARLDGLSPTELRRVRDYERRHANRKSVLDSIERALA